MIPCVYTNLHIFTLFNWYLLISLGPSPTLSKSTVKINSQILNLLLSFNKRLTQRCHYLARKIATQYQYQNQLQIYSQHNTNITPGWKWIFIFMSCPLKRLIRYCRWVLWESPAMFGQIR